nr:variable surface lipoprotein [Mycoplasmopsis bovis]
MKRKLMLIGGGLIFASSFPMIATSCGVKKKDVETSNSEKIKDSKPNSESKCRKSRFKETNSQSKSENRRFKNPTQNLNAENQDSRNQISNKSKCRKIKIQKLMAVVMN